MSYFFKYHTTIGSFSICEENGLITRISFREADRKIFEEKQTPLIEDAGKQLYEYIQGQRTTFSVHINMIGTEFQQKVWRELKHIPYGKTRTCKEVAQAIGEPDSHKAVEEAAMQNPILIIIPSHRLVGASDKLLVNANALATKERMLAIEQKDVKEKRKRKR